MDPIPAGRGFVRGGCVIPGIGAAGTLGVSGPLPAGSQQGPELAQAALSPPPGAGARVNSAATSGTSARGEHGTAARHGAAGSSARVPKPHTAPCPGPAPAPTFLPRAQPRSLRFYRKGAVALLGRQMALRPQAWRFGSARAPRAAPAEAAGRRGAGRGGGGRAGAGGPAGGSRPWAAAGGGDPAWRRRPDLLLSGGAPR